MPRFTSPVNAAQPEMLFRNGNKSFLPSSLCPFVRLIVGGHAQGSGTVQGILVGLLTIRRRFRLIGEAANLEESNDVGIETKTAELRFVGHFVLQLARGHKLNRIAAARCPPPRSTAHAPSRSR